jgi:hypothetical protein
VLTGDLGEFAVRDLLALVGRAGATGALVLHAAGDARIHCAGGAVTFAALRPDVSLADVLVATRFLDADQWTEAAATADPATAVAEALAANGADPVRLAGVLQGRTEEAVFELDLVRHGRFTFEPGADHLLGDAFRFAIGDVLTAVEARRRRWGALVDRIGSLDHVVAPEATGELGEADDELVLNRTQFRVLAAAARHLPVATLARVLDLGLFATAELVAGLLDQGLLVVLAPTAATTTSAPPAPVVEVPVLELVGAGVGGHHTNGHHTNGHHANGHHADGHHADVRAGRAPAPAPGGAEFVAPGDAPARDLILRLLTAVKEL